MVPVRPGGSISNSGRPSGGHVDKRARPTTGNLRVDREGPAAALVRRRAARKSDTAHASDATVDFLGRMGFDPWPSAAEVDTSGSPARSVASAVAVAAHERVPGKARRATGLKKTPIAPPEEGERAHRLGAERL
jgi:hypothetical protein